MILRLLGCQAASQVTLIVRMVSEHASVRQSVESISSRKRRPILTKSYSMTFLYDDLIVRVTVWSPYLQGCQVIG